MLGTMGSGPWRPWILTASFVCCCLAMLVSGSLYVFALYAPSFATDLGYSQTQVSTIAVIGDIGLYGVGPLSGALADRFGPRKTSLLAGLLLGSGYSLLSQGYARGRDLESSGQAPTHFLVMAGCLFLAGMGCSVCYMAAFTSLAKNFRQARGIALGIPVSFFGLSAAALTLVAQAFFMVSDGTFQDKQELDTTRFLLFLGLSGGLINAISIIGMNIVPASESADAENPHGTTDQSNGTMVPHEQSPLLRDDTPTDSLVANTDPTVPQGDTSLSRDDTLVSATIQGQTLKPQPSISGKAFFLDKDAQSFFVVMLCLAGTGLMIINSISAMVNAVAAEEDRSRPPGSHGKPSSNPTASTRAAHVALISLTSYIGRILAGFGSDLAIARWGALRIYVLPLATGCMALAQLVGMVASLQWLYLCSSLTGLAYGGFFGVAGTIVAELWGASSCGQNWGWLSWGAALGGMLFNLLFGVLMDASRPIVDGEPQVCKGRGCFQGALAVSFLACAASCFLSVLMSRRQHNIAASRLH